MRNLTDTRVRIASVDCLDEIEKIKTEFKKKFKDIGLVIEIKYKYTGQKETNHNKSNEPSESDIKEMTVRLMNCVQQLRLNGCQASSQQEKTAVTAFVRLICEQKGWDEKRFSTIENKDGHGQPRPKNITHETHTTIESTEPRTAEMDAWLHTKLEEIFGEPSILYRGTCVQIHGLTSKLQYNGCRGTVLLYDDDSDRYAVQLSSRDSFKKIKVRRNNVAQILNAQEEHQPPNPGMSP